VKLRNSILATALCLSFATGSPTAHASADDLASFDAQIARGLPTRVCLPTPESGQRCATVTQRLYSQIDTPQSGSARLFEATVNGRPALIVRTDTGLNLVGADENEPVMTLADATDALPAPGEALPAPVALTNATAYTVVESDADAAPEDAIHIWIFLHDTAGENDHAKFLNRYVDWWIKDMEKTIKPGMPVRVSVRDHVPGITDLNYDEGRDFERALDVAQRGAKFARSEGAAITRLTKFVLFVDRPPTNWPSNRLGVAVEKFGASIISNRGHRHVFAHEMGHLFGATHEAAEDRFWCITNMKDSEFARIPCWYYSGANDEYIRRYIAANRRK